MDKGNFKATGKKNRKGAPPPNTHTEQAHSRLVGPPALRCGPHLASDTFPQCPSSAGREEPRKWGRFMSSLLVPATVMNNMQSPGNKRSPGLSVPPGEAGQTKGFIC